MFSNKTVINTSHPWLETILHLKENFILLEKQVVGCGVLSSFAFSCNSNDVLCMEMYWRTWLSILTTPKGDFKLQYTRIRRAKIIDAIQKPFHVCALFYFKL